METKFQITPTKILVPRRRSDLLSRQRLLDTLFGLLDNKLMILAAPAGYGKTSLLIDFAHNTEWPFCWYSLDELDREPQRFLSYFISTIAQQFPDFGKRSMAVLESMVQGDLNLDSIVSVIVNDAYENITEHFVVVLDDYHLVDESSAVGFFLSRLIQDIDDNCHVIISTRTMISLPDLPLLVARSQVGGISFEELAFNPTELQNLLLQNYQQTMSEVTAKELIRQSEGWITGLLMSTQMMAQGMTDRLRLSKTSGVGLYDYLATQVMSQQPPELQTFLLRTSLLGEFDANLCRDVIGKALSIEQDWEEMMDVLVRNNLYVLPLGEQSIWLRYHPLFLDFLRAQMIKERSEEADLILACMISVFIQRGDWDRTYALLRRLNKTDELIGLIEQVGGKLVKNGRLITLQDWLDAIPGERIYNSAILLSLKGILLMMRGDPRNGLDLLDRAVAAMDPEKDRFHLANTLVRRSIVFRTLGQYDRGLIDSERAFELCEGLDDLKSVRAEALRMKGLAYSFMGRVKEGLEQLSLSLEAYLEIADEQSAAILGLDIGLLNVSLGNYLAAEYAYTKSLEYWQRTNNATWLSNIFNNLGDLQRLIGDFETALGSLEKAIEYARVSGYLRLEAYSLASIGDLYHDLDAKEQAQDAYHKARNIANRIHERFLLVYLDLAEAVLLNAHGNSYQAGKVLKNAEKLAQSSGSNYEMNLYRLEFGRINALNKQYQQAIPELSTALAYFTQEGHINYGMRARFYLAVCKDIVEPGEEARKELKGVIEMIAAPEYRAAQLTAVRELRGYLEKIKKDAELTLLAGNLFDEVDQVEHAILAMRRSMRRKAIAIPFAPPKMYIQALGKAQVRVNDRVVSHSEWQTQMACDLFFFLLARQEGITKEAVGEVFWLDSSPAELKMRFKNTIYRVRHALGKDVIVFQDELYRFNTALDYEYDVESFYRAIYHAERSSDNLQKITHYQNAVKLYQGPYLPESDEIWILSERQNIFNIYLNALLKLSALFLDERNFENALIYTQKALSEDPCLEDAHRLAMRIHAAMGNRAGVVRQFEYCRQVLSEELNVLPSENTQALFQMLTH